MSYPHSARNFLARSCALATATVFLAGSILGAGANPDDSLGRAL